MASKETPAPPAVGSVGVVPAYVMTAREQALVEEVVGPRMQSELSEV